MTNGYPNWLKRLEPWALVLLLLYFAGRIVYLAVNLHPALPPDELQHYQRVQLFSEVTAVPDDADALAAATLVPGEPYLYYWIAGKAVWLNVFPFSDRVFLRLINGAFGILTVVYGWLWVRLFTTNPLARMLFAVMITNTLMFTVMSAALSYDPLLNLCAAAAIYHATAFFVNRAGESLLWMALFLAAGALIKKTMLPLAAVLVLCVLIHERSRLFQAPQAAGAFWGGKLPGRWALTAAVIALSTLAGVLYGGNLVEYGRLVPAQDQVLSDAAIMSSPVWARNEILARYRAGEYTFEQAMRRAEAIAVDALRRDTQNLLTVAENKRRHRVEFEPLPRYLYPFPWVKMMAERFFGFLGHEHVLKKGFSLLPYFALFLLAAGVFFERWRPWRQEDFEGYAAFLVVFYCVVLMQFVNYRAYLRTEELIITMQGRYLFPIIVPMFGLVARYALDYWPRKAQVGIVVAATIAFIYGDFPFLLLNAEPNFFGNP